MDGISRNGEAGPQLLDLIPKNREWLGRRDGEIRGHGSSDEKKLELRLGPPGEEEPVLSPGYFSNNVGCAGKRAFAETVERSINGSQTQQFSSSESPSGGAVLSPSPWPQQKKSQFLQFPTPAAQTQAMPVMAKESSPSGCTKLVGLQAAEKKTFSPPSANTAVPNSSQKRTAPAPVVGWPPLRSFRKNLATNNPSKPSPVSRTVVPDQKVACDKPQEGCRKGLFVKINMDGVPIGRKVDLNAYNSYDQLSSAVDELFRGLLAAQKDSSGCKKKEDEKAITGLLDGSGEYTLVYEDNEGDRMLVGDVPWHMFVSTAKRLRVLKSSEISALSLGSSKQEKMRLLSGMK